MMTFQRRPIARKLLLTTLASSATALVLASGGFLTWDIIQFRSEIRADITAQAQIVADASGAALDFTDEDAAQETLDVLKRRPQVVLACLYDESGMLFWDYRRDSARRCPENPPTANHFGWDRLDVVTTVNSREQPVGTLLVSRELQDVYARLRVGIATMIGLLLLAIAASFLMAASMQRVIVSPMLQLADTANAISTTRDYSLRAAPGSEDEIGVVVRAFNEMLDRIREGTTELEREVEERRRLETERTAALERERDANRLKDEFLATLSHELRTPLNAVLGWARVLRSAKVDPATEAKALESIERNARAQARLIEDLLEISRIVTGKLRLQVRDVDLAAIVDAAIEVIQPAAAAKRLQVTTDITTRPAITAGDPDRLQQIIWNLLSNAVKFTPAEGRITIRLTRGAGYRLTVRDSGPGIEPKFLPFVFEPFRQADGTASREHGGLGLGLAIAKQLVELHGGTIEAYSLGHGTGATFELFLPSVVAHVSPGTTRDEPVAALPPQPMDGEMLRDLRVLVVDDEEDARALAYTALRGYGADVITASSAAEALRLIDRHHPDILVSDIGMPHEDGYSLLRQLRTRPPSDGGTIPAIALTAYASMADRRAARAAGYDAHISKPFEPAELAAMVRAKAGTLETREGGSLETGSSEEVHLEK